MRVRVYIDGFNLYYGMKQKMRQTRRWKGVRWLDLHAFSKSFLRRDDYLDGTFYFTARVSGGDTAQRQDTYWQALDTLPDVELIEGRFALREKRGKLTTPPYRIVTVEAYEEKRSDVNLAARLVFDGCQGLYQKAIVISNDSDLTEPVRLVTQVMGKEVLVFNPHPANTRSDELHQYATNGWELRMRRITANQLPNPVITVWGARIEKPECW